jgi:CheY-like chemotaxis protein
MIARAIPRADPSRSRLLYVEGHAENVALVQALLAGRKDVLVLRAANASLGLKLARAERPEAILIDLELAGMSALGFMKALRADPDTAATPVLALGAELAPKALVATLEAGFFQVLAKPLQAAPLLAALDFALEFTAVERSEQITFKESR